MFDMRNNAWLKQIENKNTTGTSWREARKGIILP